MRIKKRIIIFTMLITLFSVNLLPMLTKANISSLVEPTCILLEKTYHSLTLSIEFPEASEFNYVAIGKDVGYCNPANNNRTFIYTFDNLKPCSLSNKYISIKLQYEYMGEINSTGIAFSTEWLPTIQKSGDYDYVIEGDKANIVGYNGSESNVKIPDKLHNFTVNAIESSVFNDNIIQTITIPASIKRINDAVRYCELLTSVTFLGENPPVFNYYGYSSLFYDCNNLSKIYVPNGYSSAYQYPISSAGANSTLINEKIDLASYYINGSDGNAAVYDPSYGLEVNSSNSVHFGLSKSFRTGDKLHVQVQGSHEGTKDFRSFLANEGLNGGSNIVNGMTGQSKAQFNGNNFKWEYTLTVTNNTVKNLIFKGPDGGTDLDNLTIHSLDVRYESAYVDILWSDLSNSGNYNRVGYNASAVWNVNEEAVRVTTGDYSQGIVFKFNLPEGNSLADYESFEYDIKFDSDNPVSFKRIRADVADNIGSSIITFDASMATFGSGNLYNEIITNGRKWYTNQVIPLANPSQHSNRTGEVYVAIGLNAGGNPDNGGNAYFIKNVRLNQKGEESTPAPTSAPTATPTLAPTTVPTETPTLVPTSTPVPTPQMLSWRMSYSPSIYHVKRFTEGETEHRYRFTYYATSSYPETVAITLNVPTGVDYHMQVIDTENGNTITGAYSINNNTNKIIRMNKPNETRVYEIRIWVLGGIIDTSSPYDTSSFYELTIESPFVLNQSFTGNFTPTVLSNPGAPLPTVGGVPTAAFSNIATIDLSNRTDIPNSAEVTGVNVSGTVSYSTGNTKLRIQNSITAKRYESVNFSSGLTLFEGISNSLEPVRANWTLDYYTYAGMATTYSKPTIKITYRYNKYENY